MLSQAKLQADLGWMRMSRQGWGMSILTLPGMTALLDIMTLCVSISRIGEIEKLIGKCYTLTCGVPLGAPGIKV